MHGLDCLVELLGFEISLIKSGGDGVHTDLNVFGLDLLAATLTAGKSGAAISVPYLTKVIELSK